MEEDKYYTVKEITELLGVTRSTIDRYVKKGKLTRYKFGARTLFKANEIYSLIKTQKN
ncbi:helix-turn-helix transcriptional regulator [Lonepinella sp. MS14435]|uniref:helix-turn-helix transcriptional regulator n=1 Tax=Lonepinella sp. MS14435 TaxID=3003618 RepID=UPI0036D7FF37